MPRVYVSIGSNIEREKNIRGAVEALRQRFGELQLSRVYETRAEGFDGDNFYNLVAGFDTGLGVEQIHAALARIETDHGRTRATEKYGPRTLDIDLMLYGDLVQHNDKTKVPRPELLRFAFMLGPLAEIAPGLRHPKAGETMEQLWRAHPGYGSLQAVPFDFARSR